MNLCSFLSEIFPGLDPDCMKIMSAEADCSQMDRLTLFACQAQKLLRPFRLSKSLRYHEVVAPETDFILLSGPKLSNALPECWCYYIFDALKKVM